MANKTLKAAVAEIAEGGTISEGVVYETPNSEGADAPVKKGGKSATRKKEAVEAEAAPFTTGFVENNEAAVEWIDSNDVVLPENGFNIREDYGNIKELAASIKANGIKVPLRGYYNEEGKFVAVHGHRRTTALQQLLSEGVSVRVPVMLEAEGTSDAQRIVEMFITNDGKELAPLEKAHGVARLVEGGLKTKEIATSLGVTDRYVQKLNKLYKAPEELKALIKSGVISATYALDIMSQGEDAIAELIRRAEEGSLRLGEGEYEGEEEGEGSSRITKKDEAKGKNEDNQKSMAILKKYINNTDEDIIHEDKVVFFRFMQRILNNEMSERAINLFFKKA